MQSFLWTQCLGGIISTDVDGKTCICNVFGNPPAPTKYVHCPTSE